MGVNMFLVGDEVRLKVDDGRARAGAEEFNHGEAVITHFLPDVKGGMYLDSGLRGFRYWNILDVEWTPRQALRKVLNCIDAVPQSTELPAMPGFDRDWVESLIDGNLEGWPPLTFDDAIRMSLEWIDALPEKVAEALPVAIRVRAEDARLLLQDWEARAEPGAKSGLEM